MKEVKLQTEENNLITRNQQYELPPGWKWVRLGEVCEIVSKGTTPTTYGYSFVSSGVPFLRAEDIRGGPIDFSSVVFHVTRETHDFLNRSKLFPGDLLITIAGTLGRVGYIQEGAPETNCNQAVAFARVNPVKADVKFLCYILQVYDVASSFTGLKAGGTIQNLNLEQVRSIKIPLPPLPEQHRIAAKIQELMQEVERAQNACKKRLEAAKALPSAYLHEIFESEEARKWERKRLGEVLEVIESGSRPKGGVSEIKEGIPSIGAEHLNSLGGFIFANLRFIPKEFYKKMNRGKIQKSDVLVVKDGATTGKISFIGDNFPYDHAAVNEHVFRLRTKEFLEQEYLFWFLYSPLGQSQIKQEFHGAAQGGINQQFVNGVFISIPPVSIQRRIATGLKEKINYVEKLQSAIQDQQSALEAIPQAILRKAFRGEI